MALTTCGECRRQISESAASCQACGAPRAKAAEAAVVTTQQTGKRAKGLQLLAVLIMSVGTVSCVAQEIGASAALWAIGFSIYFYARASAWWRHG